MKRNSGTQKILFQLAVVGIIVGVIVEVIATGVLVFLTLGDMTREYQPEKAVPRINMNNVTKVTDILNAKESSVKIDLDTREVQFGREEPFE